MNIAVHTLLCHFAGKKLKEKFSKFLDTIHSKKGKLKRKKEVAPTRWPAVTHPDDRGSNDSYNCDNVRKNIITLIKKTPKKQIDIRAVHESLPLTISIDRLTLMSKFLLVLSRRR